MRLRGGSRSSFLFVDGVVSLNSRLRDDSLSALFVSERFDNGILKLFKEDSEFGVNDVVGLGVADWVVWAFVVEGFKLGGVFSFEGDFCFPEDSRLSFIVNGDTNFSELFRDISFLGGLEIFLCESDFSCFEWLLDFDLSLVEIFREDMGVSGAEEF